MTSASAGPACPIGALRNDHRRAMRLVGLLVERIDRLRRLEPGDVELTHDIFRYMVDFVDRQHHGREDRVIEALVGRAPELEVQVSQMRGAHDELQIESDTLLRELSAMRERDGVAGPLIVPKLANYAGALSSHFDSEERELFDRAAEVLTEADWREIDAEDKAAADPLFGRKVEQGYEELFEAYCGRVCEIGAPAGVSAPRAAAALVDSAAALLDGAKAGASALVAGSKRAVHANLAGAKGLAQSRNLFELAAAATAWKDGAVSETRATVRRLKQVTRDTAHSTIDPLESAFANGRQFAVSHQVDRSKVSWQSHLVNLGLRTLVKRNAGKASLESLRGPQSKFEQMMTIDADVIVETFPAGGGILETFQIEGMQPERSVLMIPGGGFVMRATQAHRQMAARIARQSHARVALINYRLAPEHPFPAGLDDCVAAYRDLLDAGIDPAMLVVMGDSAGGCLTLSAMLRAKAEGLPLPAAIALISPVTDLTYGGASRQENRWADPSMPLDESNFLAETYLKGVSASHPLVSPLFADLSGLPAILVQVGSVETLLDDSLRMAAKVRAAGGDCECEVWHEMPHDFLLFGMLPEAKKALAHVLEFIARHTPAVVPAGAAPLLAARKKRRVSRLRRASSSVSRHAA